MTEQKIHKFKLVDREGFIKSNPRNKSILELYMNNGVFEGVIDRDYDLIPVVGARYTADILISSEEFKYFEEISVPNLEGHVTMDELQEILHAEESSEPDSIIFAPENKQTVSKYKYTPLEVESVFDLKEHLANGNLFYGKPNNIQKIMHEWGLLQVIVEDKHTLWLREEVKWKDEVLSYLREDSDDSFVEELPSRIEVKFDEDDTCYLVDSEFLEMCRVALRATGELK